MSISHKTKEVELADPDVQQSEAEEWNLEKIAQEANAAIRRKRKDTLVQSLGLLVFLFTLAAAALTIGFSEGDSRTTYLVMFFATCAGIWLAAYRFRYIAITVGGLQVLIYTLLQLYRAIGSGRSIGVLDYAWLLIPILCIGAMSLFMLNMYNVERVVELLEDRLHSMEVIEPVTGLNNLKSMYMDLDRQIAYAQRNQVELSLIIFELRYYQELKSILSAVQLSEVKRQMGRLVEDSLRLEDKVYAIDDRGSLGLVCIGCGDDGAALVKNRIVSMLSQKESFSEVLDRNLRVDIRAGFYTYNKDEIRNAIEFKKKVENELQYDV